MRDSMIGDLKEKFQLGLMYLLAPFTAICIAPIAIYRYLNGEYLTAALDAAIVAAVLLTVGYVRWQQTVRVPAMVSAVFYTTGAVLTAYLNGPFYIFWLYPAVLANFFLLNPRLALGINLSALLVAVPVALQTTDPILTVGMMGSLLFSIGMTFGFARLIEKQRDALRTAASHDALTGVGNRRLMDGEINRSIERFRRHPSPTSLIVLDLDMFKCVNDRLGHKAGDHLLVAVAELLMRQTRNADRVFRFGGEEFVLLAEHTNLEEAGIIAEHLRQQIAIRIRSSGEPLTASFGCAQLQLDEAADQWFRRADKALFDAKHRGRNCVVLAEEVPQ